MEIVGHEFLINHPILQIVIVTGTTGAEENGGIAVLGC
jgi:hypothetical protein